MGKPRNTARERRLWLWALAAVVAMVVRTGIGPEERAHLFEYGTAAEAGPEVSSGAPELPGREADAAGCQRRNRTTSAAVTLSLAAPSSS